MLSDSRRLPVRASGSWRRVILVVAAGLCLSLAASASAEEPEPDADSVDDSRSVETVADPQQPTSDPRHPSGWATQVEPDDEFGRGGDLGDTLESVSGLAIQRQSGLGQPAFATIRGGNPRQLTLLLNGIRIGAPVGVGFNIGGVSTSWVDSVDVYRGAAAAPWGAGSLTGAMNLRAHPPEQEGWRASATGMGGSFGTVGVATHAASRGESVAADLDASWRQSDGAFGFVDDQGTTHERINNAHEQLSLAGTAEADVGKLDLQAAVVHENMNRGAPGPSEFQQRYDRARVDSDRTIATLGLERRNVASGGWGMLDLKLGAGYVHRGLDYRNDEPFLVGQPVSSVSTHDAATVTAGLSGFFDVGNITHLTVEARTARYDAESDFESTTTLVADRQTLGVGLSNELLLFDQAVSLIAGLRTELVDGRRGLSVPVMPAGGIVWRAVDWLSLKANVARTHRTPDFDELYLQTETIRGNRDLDPERATNWDAGLVAESEDFPLSGTVVGFWTDMRETIMFLPVTAYRFEARNLEGAVARGLETAAKLEFEPRWRTRLAYTWTDAFLKATPSKQLPHRPEHRANLTTRVELAGIGPFEALESLQFRAGGDVRSRVNLDNFGNLTNPPYWQLDLGMRIAPTRGLQVGIEARNITDNRRGADFLQRPLPGRSIYASLTLSDGPSRQDASQP